MQMLVALWMYFGPMFHMIYVSVARPASHPPWARFQIRYAHPISLDCHQLYIIVVAKPYAWLQEPSRSRSVVIFIKYREVSTHMILPNFIDLSAETTLYSRFGGHKGSVVTG